MKKYEITLIDTKTGKVLRYTFEDRKELAEYIDELPAHVNYDVKTI